MRIKEEDDSRIEIDIINSTFRGICYIFIGLGSIVSISVIGSGEALHNGIFGYLLLITGITALKFGGKSDKIILDKRYNTLEITIFEKEFSKAKISTYFLKEIISVKLKEIENINGDSYSSNKYCELEFETKSGEKIIATRSLILRKKYKKITNIILDFIKN